MTNLGQLWYSALPTEYKNHFKRSGSIIWCFLPSGRSVSVYNCGHGYVIKIHDNMTFRHRYSQKVSLGTVKKDTLCLDATETRIAVGGLVSQKVWVFNVKEKVATKRGRLDMLWDMLVRGGNGGANGQEFTTISTEIFKFIHAGVGVARVKLHSDNKRMAVLLPLNQTVEIWDIKDVFRLQSHSVPSDSCYLLWQKNLLLTAPLYSGVIQAIDTEKERELKSIVGSIRRIDAVAVYENLCATGEGRWVKLWSLLSGEELIHWCATKTFVTSMVSLWLGYDIEYVHIF